MDIEMLVDDSAQLSLINAAGSTSLTSVAGFQTSTFWTSPGTTPFVPGENHIEVVVNNSGGVATGFNLTGQITAQCCNCEPLPDGSACKSVICPNPEQVCTPAAIGFHNVCTGDFSTRCDEEDDCLAVGGPCVDAITVVDLSDVQDAVLAKPYPANRTIDACPHD